MTMLIMLWWCERQCRWQCWLRYDDVDDNVAGSSNYIFDDDSWLCYNDVDDSEHNFDYDNVDSNDDNIEYSYYNDC